MAITGNKMHKANNTVLILNINMIEEDNRTIKIERPGMNSITETILNSSGSSQGILINLNWLLYPPHIRQMSELKEFSDMLARSCFTSVSGYHYISRDFSGSAAMQMQ